MTDEDVVLAFKTPRDRVAPVTEFRSTWIVASVQALRACGYFERYVDLLPVAHRAEILDCVAGIWLPIALARAHYVACQSLGLSSDEQFRMGDYVGKRGAATLISTVARAARQAGVTPWTVFPQLDRIWRRGANGGAVAVTRCGPKEALGEVVGCELFELGYFRTAFRGVVLGMMGQLCTSIYVRETGNRTANSIRLRFQWT